ncbi:hypothetical protein IMG5_154770 [Ichthyophthirius multifiliis]|uniref:Uncharacterized protein n=1 Tax=Ichthyophthirius multifiliis TaxID=5932 RepID=G0QZ71_ICHMU|nr:hypothetical protein IMG5_154770 [Ichthyophthirius multifiliis]EGR29494.1 hypothetical protein IMG5_154770 [Ichthyophthirius multifiliis]|eukprot:XP_004030730.1 hypothetical protein IMG5_154770 [Ichthyophthirius multifiliis]
MAAMEETVVPYIYVQMSIYRTFIHSKRLKLLEIKVNQVPKEVALVKVGKIYTQVFLQGLQCIKYQMKHLQQIPMAQEKKGKKYQSYKAEKVVEEIKTIVQYYKTKKEEKVNKNKYIQNQKQQPTVGLQAFQMPENRLFELSIYYIKSFSWKSKIY